MNTLPNELYRIMESGLGGETWQQFVDRYNEKYNGLNVDGFTFQTPRLDYTFSQLITSLGVVTLPSYVDPESPGYEASLRTIEGRTGNIPTQKKFYRLNRQIVRQQLQLASYLGEAGINDQMRQAFMSLLDEGTDGLITSYYNGLTHQRMQIVSTGRFTINADNNPRGLKGISLDFGVPSNHLEKLAGESRWWKTDEHVPANEGTASDPILYLKTKVREIRRKFHVPGRLRLEMSRELWEDLQTHTKVLTRIGHALYPTVTDDATVLANAQNVNETQLLDQFRRLVGVDSIVTQDSYAFVDEPGTDEDGAPDIIARQVENFKGTNIAILPEGNIGEIQGVVPISIGYDADKVASYDGGRLKLTQYAEPRTNSMYVQSESAQLCVPSVPHYMFISEVTV